jgi:hypothetical protein
MILLWYHMHCFFFTAGLCYKKIDQDPALENTPDPDPTYVLLFRNFNSVYKVQYLPLKSIAKTDTVAKP